MKICYDTEFIENGKTIELISIGLVTEDGAEYYAINADMPIFRIRRNSWLMANVMAHMPQPSAADREWLPQWWTFDFTNHQVKRRRQIADEVREFIANAAQRSTEKLQLWADYGAYDHVVLCQLFGSMTELPSGIPMFTHDLQHELDRRGLSNRDLPIRLSAEHHALYDARYELDCLKYLGMVPTSI